MDTSRQPEILIVEDSDVLAFIFKEFLQTAGYEARIQLTGREGLEVLAAIPVDLVILDLNLPDMHGFDFLTSMSEQGLNVPVIVATASNSLDIAREAIDLGAIDFLTKPVPKDRLVVTVRNVLEQRRLASLVDRYQEGTGLDSFGELIGASPIMQGVYQTIKVSAPSRANIFITGESGTGKELCAKAIHSNSERSQEMFWPINCAAIPHDLMESEIFGHVKGAYTGAHSARDGAALKADAGTLFLDEICELNLDLQSKLLRFIQTGSFHKVGSDNLITVDIRFICATNRDPLEEVRAGRFREDLFYGLHVIAIRMPPLRERGDDILRLANTLLEKQSSLHQKTFKGFTPQAEALLRQHPWPGNVRELENVILSAVVMAQGPYIQHFDLSLNIRDTSGQQSERRPRPDIPGVDQPPQPTENTEAGVRPLWLEEKLVIERAIAICDGNVVRASELLEVSASTIYRKRQGWGLDQEVEGQQHSD